MKTVSVQQDNGEGGVVEKRLVRVSTPINEATALIDPETLDLRRLDYVQEAQGGGVAYQRLPIQTEYLSYVDIDVSDGRTFRFPSLIKGVFNRTKHQQIVLKDFAVKIESDFVED